MSRPDPACPDYPNDCMHPWAHARTYAEVQAAERSEDPAIEAAYERGVAAGRKQAAADIRERVQRVWPDPTGRWTADQADAARATLAAVRRPLDAGDGGEPRG